jgi:single-strand DNA-binding protein
MQYTSSGQPRTFFSVASSRRYTTTDGEQREETQWFNVNVFGRQAESCNQYLEKGRQVYVEGRFSSRLYQGNDGQTRISNDIMASDVQFLGSRSDMGQDRPPYGGVGSDMAEGRSSSGGGRMGNDPYGDDVDDLPF